MKRHVERIQPDDARLAGMGVFMPSASRRQDQIALVHRTDLAVDRGRAVAAFQHEPQRVRGMAMDPRGFPRQKDLNAGIQIGGDAGAAGGVEIRIGQ